MSSTHPGALLPAPTHRYLRRALALSCQHPLPPVAAWARIALIDVNVRRPPPKRKGGQGDDDEFGDCCAPTDGGPLLRANGSVKGSVLSGWQAALGTRLFAWDVFRRSIVALKCVPPLRAGAGARRCSRAYVLTVAAHFAV